MDSALKNAGSMVFAPQRFDTIMEVSTAIAVLAAAGASGAGLPASSSP